MLAQKATPGNQVSGLRRMPLDGSLKFISEADRVWLLTKMCCKHYWYLSKKHPRSNRYSHVWRIFCSFRSKDQAPELVSLCLTQISAAPPRM